MQGTSDAESARLRPFGPEAERLQTIPGVGCRTAHVLLAELGPDLNRSPAPGMWSPGPGCVQAMIRLPFRSLH